MHADVKLLMGLQMTAIPDRVAQCPLADDNVSPAKQRLASLLIVFVMAQPPIDQYGEALLLEICLQVSEELEVMTC
ncbi:hypothetical protein D3C84_712850 [compost metagenome]